MHAERTRAGRPHRAALWAALFLVCGLAAACGSDNGDADGPSGPPTDNGTGGEDSRSGGTSDLPPTSDALPPAGQPVTVSFTRERATGAEGVDLVVIDTTCRPGDCPNGAVLVGGHDFSCASHLCRLSTSGGHVLFRDPSTPSTLRVASLDAGFQLTGPSTVLAEDVERFVERGDTVAWIAGDSAFAQALGSGQTVSLGAANGGDSLARSATLQLSEDGQRVFLMGVGLNRLSIYEVSAGGGDVRLIYRLDSGLTTTSGSLFTGNEPVFVGGGDEFLYIGVGAVMLHGICDSDANCAGEQFCSRDWAPARCAEYSTYVARISTEDSALLGQGCGTDGQCGAGHACDVSAPDAAAGLGVCRPARHRIGGSGPNACAGWAEGQFTQIRENLGMLADGRLALLATTPCESGNVDRTALLAVPPSFDGVEVIAGMEGTNHGGAECQNPQTLAFDYEKCTVALTRMVVADDGATVVALGNSVASRTTEQLWVFDAFGRTTRSPLAVALFDGERDTWRIRSVRVHPTAP